ncbi:hypothetical protein [Microcoleus sp. B3-D7]|uniref:hypothetical protein n=1 Tax=Microcoleus sp. B3-D7 TaxID=2818659 RepID=UPI002FD25C85
MQLINGLTFRQLSISPGTDGTLITVAGSGEALASLIGVAPNLIGSEDFISVYRYSDRLSFVNPTKPEWS